MERLVPSQPSPPSGLASGRDDVKERVREAIDIVDLVGSYISLRRAGKGCPRLL